MSTPLEDKRSSDRQLLVSHGRVDSCQTIQIPAHIGVLHGVAIRSKMPKRRQCPCPTVQRLSPPPRTLGLHSQPAMLCLLAGAVTSFMSTHSASLGISPRPPEPSGTSLPANSCHLGSGCSVARARGLCTTDSAMREGQPRQNLILTVPGAIWIDQLQACGLQGSPSSVLQRSRRGVPGQERLDVP